MNGHSYGRGCIVCEGKDCVYLDENHHRRVQNAAYIKQTVDAAMAGDGEALLALRCVIATIAIKAPANVILSMNFFAVDMEEPLSDGAVVRMVDEETPTHVPTRDSNGGGPAVPRGGVPH